MSRPTNSLVTSLIACLILGAGTAGPGMAQTESRIVYTRHAVAVDTHDLDLSRSADRQVFHARVTTAADEICGERPDKTNRYNAREIELLMPAYAKCRTDAIDGAIAFASAKSGVRLDTLDTADSRPRP